jgi:YbgC/YbaW family acyl-CoA thioester hydrolase
MIELKYKIGFSDCDPAGIIFYSRVFEFCHKVYEELISSFNLEENYWSNQNYLVPIISSSSKYLKPLKYNDEVTIRLIVKELKKSSFELHYSIYKDNDLSVVINTVHVFVNPKTWEKTEIPVNIKDKLNKHVDKIEEKQI